MLCLKLIVEIVRRYFLLRERVFFFLKENKQIKSYLVIDIPLFCEEVSQSPS